MMTNTNDSAPPSIFAKLLSDKGVAELTSEQWKTIAEARKEHEKAQKQAARARLALEANAGKLTDLAMRNATEQAKRASSAVSAADYQADAKTYFALGVKLGFNGPDRVAPEFPTADYASKVRAALQSSNVRKEADWANLDGTAKTNAKLDPVTSEDILGKVGGTKETLRMASQFGMLYPFVSQKHIGFIRLYTETELEPETVVEEAAPTEIAERRVESKPVVSDRRRR